MTIFVILIIFLLSCVVKVAHCRSHRLDAVVVTSAKANDVLFKYSIESAMKHLIGVNTYYVISPNSESFRLKYESAWTNDKVRFIDENIFPFNKNILTKFFVEQNLISQNETQQLAINAFNSRVGWYLQQLIKLYAGDILDLNDYVILDSDIIWYQDRILLYQHPGNTSKLPMYNYAFSNQNFGPYKGSSDLLLNLKSNKNEPSGIVHHIVIVKEVMIAMKKVIETRYEEFTMWQAIIIAISKEFVTRKKISRGGCAFSEYYTYFLYAQRKYPETVHRNQLLWANGPKPTAVWDPKTPIGGNVSDYQVHVDSRLHKMGNMWVFSKNRFEIQMKMDQLMGWDMISYHYYATRRYYEFSNFDKISKACAGLQTPYFPILKETTCSWDGFLKQMKYNESQWFEGCLCFQYKNAVP